MLLNANEDWFVCRVYMSSVFSSCSYASVDDDDQRAPHTSAYPCPVTRHGILVQMWTQPNLALGLKNPQDIEATFDEPLTVCQALDCLHGMTHRHMRSPKRTDISSSPGARFFVWLGTSVGRPNSGNGKYLLNSHKSPLGPTYLFFISSSQPLKDLYCSSQPFNKVSSRVL